MNLSIIIPFFNERDNFKVIVSKIEKELDLKDFEVIFINDFSTDDSIKILKSIINNKKKFRLINNQQKKGLGGAIRTGIINSKGRFLSVMMCDMSDSILDLKYYYRLISKNNLDAVLGSRFIRGSQIKNYPKLKYFLNRLFNLFVKLIFFSNYNDFTNAFKIYSRRTILDIFPLVSEDFNIFLEIPLKIIYRKYKYKVIPISWNGREIGKSKFRLKELRSKYIFTLLYCFMEKILLKR